MFQYRFPSSPVAQFRAKHLRHGVKTSSEFKPAPPIPCYPRQSPDRIPRSTPNSTAGLPRATRRKYQGFHRHIPYSVSQVPTPLHTTSINDFRTVTNSSALPRTPRTYRRYSEQRGRTRKGFHKRGFAIGALSRHLFISRKFLYSQTPI